MFWIERWEGRDSQQHQIVTRPCPTTPARSPKPSTVSSTAIWQASSHRTTIQIDISMRGPVPVFYKRHFTAVLFVLSPTPHHRVETSPFFFGAERAATGRYGEGLSSCPTAPQSVSESLPTKTGLLHIPRFCIWMSRLLFSLKCTLNLSGNNREEGHTFSPTLVN